MNLAFPSIKLDNKLILKHYFDLLVLIIYTLQKVIQIPRYIIVLWRKMKFFIAENRFPLGQCIT